MKIVSKVLVYLIIAIVICITSLNIYVISVTKSKIKLQEEIDSENIDCIIVLGAGIRGGKPSPMLEDRLLTSVDLYKRNISKKIIVSGDHGKENYDEVNVMKQYLIDKGIPSEDIFMDHAGFSTYDSIYRAKAIFEAKNVIIVTQEYHLYRSLYISKKLGLNAYGISSNRREYQNQTKRDIREIAARAKDFVKCIFKPEPKYLGESIPVSSNGNLTNDK